MQQHDEKGISNDWKKMVREVPILGNFRKGFASGCTEKSMKRLLLLLLVSGCCLTARADTTAQPRTPENQVFQFMTSESFTPKAKPGLPTTTSDAYLWIPPACRRVRGVVVMAQNVPEHWLAGHPAIRGACTDYDLAILFTCRSFLMFSTFKDYPSQDRNREHGEFVQQILNSLAAISGYAELATAPWFPMGESMALMVPNALTSGFPGRCIAGIQIKDGQWNQLKSAEVPVLVACGTAPEWDAPKHDIFTRWKEQATDDLKQHRAKRAATPAWPGSLLIEGGSAHFSVTENMAQLLAQYIRAACKARLSTDGSDALRPVNLDDGFIAGLSVPGSPPVAPVRFRNCTAEQKSLPWYFDEASAKAAFDMAGINWNAQPMLPVFADENGRPIPFNYRGITGPLKITTLDDGVTFALGAVFLDQLPDSFVGAGKPLGHVASKPMLEWLCGPYVPLGNNRFQFAMDRTWKKTDCYVRVWHPGDGEFRLSTNPGRLDFEPNKNGKPQTITFDSIPDQLAGAKEVRLHATSDSGMPVRFFVRAGPAEVHGDRLVFTPVPARSKMPVTVTVAAWQWGRTCEPAVQTAETVERSFQIR